MEAPQVIIFTDICTPGFGRYAGTYRIATELRDNGFSVQVVEYFTQWTTEELQQIIRKFVTKETLLVGISTTFLLNKILRTRTDIEEIRKMYREKDGDNHFGLFGVAASEPALEERHRLAEFLGRPDWPELNETIKECNPNTKTAVGGYQAGHIHLGEYLDYSVLGEGERSMVTLCNELLHGHVRKDKYIKLPYTGFTTSRMRFEEQDLIFPGEHLPVEIARGCIFKCGFCSYNLNGKKLWEFNRTPDLVVDDLRHAYENYGSTGFMFCDDTYNDSVEKVRTYNEAFKELPFDQTWSGYARADLIVSHPETIDMLYESGMRSVFFGIESLNHASAKSIGKGMHPDKLKEGFYKMRERWPDVLMSAGLITGLPHDTPETLRKNNEWFLQDDCPIQHPSYFPLYIAPKKQPFYGKASSENSKMGDDPWSFGYEVHDDGYWKSEWMDRTMAEEMVMELRETVGDVRGHRKQPEQGAWVFFNRMQNLGFSHEDIERGGITEEEVVLRENKLKDIYKDRLWQI